MRKTQLDYSYEIVCAKHKDDDGKTCFSADAIIRDGKGTGVTRLEGTKLHSYVEAAEDEAVEAARAEVRRLRAADT